MIYFVHKQIWLVRILIFKLYVDILFVSLLAYFKLECDEELFEDNPEEYIRRDIEGSGN